MGRERRGGVWKEKVEWDDIEWNEKELWKATKDENTRNTRDTVKQK